MNTERGDLRRVRMPRKSYADSGNEIRDLKLRRLELKRPSHLDVATRSQLERVSRNSTKNKNQKSAFSFQEADSYIEISQDLEPERTRSPGNSIRQKKIEEIKQRDSKMQNIITEIVERLDSDREIF